MLLNLDMNNRKLKEININPLKKHCTWGLQFYSLIKKEKKRNKERRETERSEPVLSEADDSLELRAMREWVRGMAPSKNIK